MPFRSQAQAAAMHAAAAGKSSLGIPAKVAQKFVAEGHGQKVGKLPAKAVPAHKVLRKEKRRAK